MKQKHNPIILVFLVLFYLPFTAGAEDLEYGEIKAIEEGLWSFVQSITLKDGITPARWNPYSGPSDMAFSETLGLRMEYLIMRGDQEGFEKEMEVLEREFLTSRDLIQWEIQIHQSLPRVGSNALVDDLRILQSLIEAGDLWPELKEDSLALARRIAGAMEERQFLDSGFLAEGVTFQRRLFLWEYCCLDSYAYTSYMNIRALSLLVERAHELHLNPVQWQESKSLAMDLLLSHANVPLMPCRLELATGSIQYLEEVNMINHLLSLLYLAETGYYPEAGLDFLKEEMEKSRVLGRYRVEWDHGSLSILPASVEFESPVVYALIILLGCALEELELAREGYGKLMGFLQTVEPGMYAFGFPDEEEPYHLFDQFLILQALHNLGEALL